ncbi:MAG: preprotein translocase subunit YajC [Clostridia bacterium]
MFKLLNFMSILAEEAPKEPSFFSKYGIIILMVVMMVVMLVMSIIPQKKKQKKAQEMMQQIKVGTKIKTIGGFVGEIKAIDDATNTFIINIGVNGSELFTTIDKSAVYTVINSAQSFNANHTAAAPVFEEPTTVDDMEIEEKKQEKAVKKASKKPNIEKVEAVDVEAEKVEPAQADILGDTPNSLDFDKKD